MKKFTYVIIALAIMINFSGCVSNRQPYPAIVTTWQSYEDVASWMQSHWHFDKSDQQRLIQNIKKMKAGGHDLASMTAVDISLTPEQSYNKGGGHCGDAALLIKDSLNKINPNYKAKIIFIKNVYGPPNHWATGFYVNEKLHVMDYGAGSHWSAMMGTHGPYNSLEDYARFLKSVNAKNFTLEFVRWRDID